MSRFRSKRWWWLAVPAALVLGSMSVARASGLGPFGCHHGRAESAAQVQEHMERRAERLLDRIDASDAQRTAIKGVIGRSSPEVFALMTEGRGLRTQLKDALLAETVDPERVASLEAALHALGDRMVTLGTRSMLEVSTVLTPAQRAEIAEKLAFFER